MKKYEEVKEIATLYNDIDEWNNWKNKYTSQYFDLTKLDSEKLKSATGQSDTINLTKCKLSNITFDGNNLTGVDFREATLDEVTFKDCNLTKAKFHNIDVKSVKFINCTLNNISFEHAEGLEHVDLKNFEFINASFSHIKHGLENRNFSEKTLLNIRFVYCDLSKTLFNNSTLKNCNFINCTLENTDFFNADLFKSNFERSDLNSTIITTARSYLSTTFNACTIEDKDFSKKDFTEASFAGSNVLNSSFKECILQHTSFASARFMTSKSIGGSDITGATLPDYISDFKSLSIIEEASKNLKPLFITLLFLCFYSFVTLLYSDNSETNKLPFIGINVKEKYLFHIMPVLLVLVYLYFLFYVQKIWVHMRLLPAVFQDGVALPERVFPWLLNSFSWFHLKRLKHTRKGISPSLLQYILMSMLAWGLPPTTIVIGAYLYAQKYEACFGPMFIATAALLLGLHSYIKSIKTLQGKTKKPSFAWEKIKGFFPTKTLASSKQKP